MTKALYSTIQYTVHVFERLCTILHPYMHLTIPISTLYIAMWRWVKRCGVAFLGWSQPHCRSLLKAFIARCSPRSGSHDLVDLVGKSPSGQWAEPLKNTFKNNSREMAISEGFETKRWVFKSSQGVILKLQKRLAHRL